MDCILYQKCNEWNRRGDCKIDMLRLSAESATKKKSKPTIPKCHMFSNVSDWSQQPTIHFHPCCNFACESNKHYFSHLLSCATSSNDSFFSSKPTWNVSNFGAGLCWQTWSRTCSSLYTFTVVEVSSSLPTSLSDCSSSKIQQKRRINQQVNQEIHKVKVLMVEADGQGLSIRLFLGILHLEVLIFFQ